MFSSFFFWAFLGGGMNHSLDSPVICKLTYGLMMAVARRLSGGENILMVLLRGFGADGVSSVSCGDASLDHNKLKFVFTI